jgi:hypothetical protein
MVSGISISEIRLAKLRSGMTEKEVDAEMRGLLIKISEQDNGIEPDEESDYNPHQVISQRIRRKIDAVVPVDPIVEAQRKMMEHLSETSRKDYPISIEYAEWMRKQALGENDDKSTDRNV